MKRTPFGVVFITALTIALSPIVMAQQAGRGPGRNQVTAMAESLRSGPQGFSVVLVLGDMQTATAQDNVPPAARKALADMKDFLPFKSYRLLDVQWTLCCGRSPVVSRLRGPEDQDYELELNPAMVMDGGGKVSVRFLLRDPGSPEGGGRGDTAAAFELESIGQQRRAVEAQLADQRRRYNDNHPSVVESRKLLADLQQKVEELSRKTELKRRGPVAGTFGRSRAVIDASFMMDIGETVVVGTSRVKGADKALIALLTAVPQRSAATK
jgi:hypothetical protein